MDMRRVCLCVRNSKKYLNKIESRQLYYTKCQRDKNQKAQIKKRKKRDNKSTEQRPLKRLKFRSLSECIQRQSKRILW